METHAVVAAGGVGGLNSYTTAQKMLFEMLKDKTRHTSYFQNSAQGFQFRVWDDSEVCM